MWGAELEIAQNKACAAERSGVSEQRHSGLPGRNQRAPTATVIKCWPLSTVLKSTAVSLNGEWKGAGRGAGVRTLLGKWHVSPHN